MGDIATALSRQEGWHSQGYAARVHYEGGEDRYSVEYYEPSERVLYWKVIEDGDTAVPVDRSSVPTPLRDRIRADLETVGVDPDVEARKI